MKGAVVKEWAVRGRIFIWDKISGGGDVIGSVVQCQGGAVFCIFSSHDISWYVLHCIICHGENFVEGGFVQGKLSGDIVMNRVAKG